MPLILALHSVVDSVSDFEMEIEVIQISLLERRDRNNVSVPTAGAAGERFPSRLAGSTASLRYFLERAVIQQSLRFVDFL